MPVCLLLRVHSTGPVSSIGAGPRRELVEHHPDLEPGEVRAQAVVHAVTEAEMRVRIAREVEAERIGEHRLRRGSRTLPRTRPCRRRARARRRARGRASRCGGCTRRGASSARSLRPPAPVAPLARAASGHWSGNASSATTAPAIALRVVSAPAAQSSEKKNCSSWSVSSGGSSPSRWAWQTTESMSSAGCARFSAISAAPYSNIAAAATGDLVGRLERLAPALEVEECSIHSKSRCRSSSGMPMRMQIACIGSSPAISFTKSHSPRSSAASTSAAVRVAQLGVEPGDRARGQALAHEQPDTLVARVVHHVEHQAGHRQVVQRRAAVGTRPARLRGERARVVHDGHARGVGVHRPEAVAVGRVRRWVRATARARSRAAR